MRSWIGLVLSNCAPESKKRHCLQQCNSNWHLGHVPLGSNPGVSTAPQLAHRARVTVPTMRGVRGPNWSAPRGPPAGGLRSWDLSFFSFFSASRYPRCPYFRSTNASVRQSRRTATAITHAFALTRLPTWLVSIRIVTLGRTAHSIPSNCLQNSERPTSRRRDLYVCSALGVRSQAGQ